MVLFGLLRDRQGRCLVMGQERCLVMGILSERIFYVTHTTFESVPPSAAVPTSMV
jgi:hypothetical protein